MLLESLKEYFNILTEREKEIIIKRYGLNDGDEVTQKEIAKELGMTVSQVRYVCLKYESESELIGNCKYCGIKIKSVKGKKRKTNH